jgi:large subunit ribosomal protein L29
VEAQEIRALSTDDVRSRLNDTEEEFFNLRAQFVIGQLEDFNRLTELKRDIARLKTILRERELATQATEVG